MTRIRRVHAFTEFDDDPKSRVMQARSIRNDPRPSGFGVVSADVLEDADHPGYWIRLDQWNRFRHDTYKNDREAEMPFIPDTARVPQPLPSKSSDDPATGKFDSLISPVYKHFERVGEDFHVPLTGKNAGKPQKFVLWKCRCCSESLSFKVFHGSTGVLFKHLGRFHPAEHTEARVSSKHSKLKLEADGTVTELYPFSDALPHHVRFLLWHVLDLGHLHKSKSPNFREFTSGSDKRYVPPCRNTCENIADVIRDLMWANLLTVLADTKQQLGEPFVGMQSDLWSPQDNKMSFACLRLSMILLLGGLLVDVCPLLGFEQFHENSHSGPALSRWTTQLLGRAVLSMKSITLPTLDGAGNNKKCFKNSAIENEGDIKEALTGSTNGLCDEEPVHVEPVAAVDEVAAATGDDSDDGNSDEDSESDAEQVEANEREGKEFPLQHRCLGASDWKRSRQLESCLVTPFECSQAMQGHQAVGLDKEYVLSCATHQTLTADKVEIVSGIDANERWDEVHAGSLPADIQQFRRTSAEQIENRLLNLDDDTLLALKMNPAIDTSENGPLFTNKSGSLELMEAVYNRQLRVRGKHLNSVGVITLVVAQDKDSGSGQAAESATVSVSQSTRVATVEGAQGFARELPEDRSVPVTKRRRTGLIDLA
ncbi:hypothetical protein CYMTET_28859 [Cymbomonas tetramitiformis]|uniref:Uncharacterized protein n=1 Tax=Cymbomonas tetramitiformis TaxID=36881 RepID=A0AAE0FM47_9CHLO|nr:hypothetical protein CYMTET_28859 [Cymbomonas tetramitiformis]